MVREGPSDTGALSFGSFLWANKDKEGLPVNEYLNAVIIFQLSIKLPLLAAGHTCFACPKQVSTKGHPTMPALRAPLLGGTEWGTTLMRISLKVRDIR